MHAGKMQWRGVTSAPFPGYLLIGRTPGLRRDPDLGQRRHHRPVRRDALRRQRHEVQVQGQVPLDEAVRRRHAERRPGEVHDDRARPGDRLRDRQRPQGRDLVEALQLRQGHARPAVLPQALDGRASTARSRSTRLRRRPRRPSTPSTWTTSTTPSTRAACCRSVRRGPTRACRRRARGKYEWKGWVSDSHHPHGKDPKGDELVSWNQNVARGFGAADDQWGRMGSVGRVSLLYRNLKEERNKHGKWDLARVASAMNAAATQDVRAILTVPLLSKLLKGTTAPNQQAAQMLQLLKQWREQGGSRLDRNLDGDIDDPGRGDHGRLLGPDRERPHGPAPRIADRRARLAVQPLRHATRRPVQRLVPVLRPRHPLAARQERQGAAAARPTAARAT